MINISTLFKSTLFKKVLYRMNCCLQTFINELRPMNGYLQILIRKALNPEADSDSHFITCFSMVVTLRAKKILELGVWQGGTTLPFLCGAKYTGGFVESVDINPTSFRCPRKLKPHWKFYQSDALKYLESIPEGFIYDLVYIDDWHAYEHVAKELELLAPHVNESSVILLHDLMHTFTHPNYVVYDDSNYYEVWGHEQNEGHKEQFANGGPYRAVRELDSNIWEFATIPVCHGLTVLRKKSDIASRH